MRELSREQVDEQLENIHFGSVEVRVKSMACIRRHDAAIRSTIEHQAQEIERLTQDVEKYKALLLQSCRDNIEEFKVQCKPKCDSYGHEEECPAAYPGLVYDEMRQQLATLAAREGEVGELNIKLRDAVQEAERLREVLEKGFNLRRFENAPCFICGYNGEQYYHPGTHPCADFYHTAKARDRKEST